MNQSFRGLWASAIFLVISTSVAATRAETKAPFPLRHPSISKNKIAFSYAGSIWTANHDGSSPQRLTSGGNEWRPSLSPDGSQIAFIGNYGGAGAVYVIPSSGGAPHRLTYHPKDFDDNWSSDYLSSFSTVTWTPDGRHIVFSSPRLAPTPRAFGLFSVSVEGGFAAPLPLSRATDISFSSDGTHVAYLRTQSIPQFKHYRGGATSYISIARLPDFVTLETIPRNNSNDFNPMWIGDTVYFLSDRNGPISLFSYSTTSRQVKQVIENRDLDIKSAAAFSNVIVYEQFGELHFLNLELHVDRVPHIRLSAKSENLQPSFQKISPVEITMINLSPTGDQVAIAAHGEILALPTDIKGGKQIRNLTRTADAVERNPAWSPDGRSVAYFSDVSGEYALHVLDQRGKGRLDRVKLEAAPSLYVSPVWSPDSKKIAYIAKDATYWYIDLETGRQVCIDRGLHFFHVFLEPDPALTWAPDSRWIAYTKELPSRMHAIFIYSLENGRGDQITDSTVDALHPAFDSGGQYLYFTLSDNVSLVAGISMSSYDRPVTRRICLLMLRRDSPVPTLRRPDGDDVTPVNKIEAWEGQLSIGSKTEVDFEGAHQRVLTLPIPARNYNFLYAGPPGTLYLVVGDQPVIPSNPQGDREALRVQQFNLNTLQTTQVLPSVDNPSPLRWSKQIDTFYLSFDGSTMLYQKHGEWFVFRDTLRQHTPEERTHPVHKLSLDNLGVYVDPRAEWAHMYDQVWRGVRDYFYDPGFHGLNLDATKNRYRAYLKRISTRRDLNYLFEEMLGNLTASHLLVGMPYATAPDGGDIATGLLGADYSVENGRYRIADIYGGESWNPELRAPLRQPSADIQAGEYLLTVNGRDVFPTQDIYSFFQGTAGKEIVLGVSLAPNDPRPRNTTAIPIDSEVNLRTYAWSESKRHKVDQLTNSRVGYVYLSDVGTTGYSVFNRYYFAQSGKDALIIDGRDNMGGWAPDYIIDMLRRPLLNLFHSRSGHDMSIPAQGIFGPKVMIINEQTRSGGDHLAYMFRRAGLGPLVGKRTYGALIGACASDTLLDGSTLMISNCAFYTPDSAWSVENHGVEPDLEVEDDSRPGHDLQLEASINVALQLLTRPSGSLAPKRPPYPRYRHPQRQ